VSGKPADESETSPGAGDATEAQAPPPAPPGGLGAAGRRTSCVRSSAQRRTSSPPHEARHQATGRSPDGHEDQHYGSYQSSPLNLRPQVSPPEPTEVSPMSNDITIATKMNGIINL